MQDVVSTHLDHPTGIFAAFFSFLFWGVTPFYWKALQAVSAVEVLAHRVIWSVVFFSVLIFAKQEWQAIFKILRSKKNIIAFAICAIFIGVNWYIFIWAVNTNHLVETSLGFFILPLVNVLLGSLFLKERLYRWQVFSILIAFGGVAIRIWEFGQIPWIALTLGITFGFYSLIRKKAPFGAVEGLFLETIVLAIPALFYLLHLNWEGMGSFGHSSFLIHTLLIGTGLISALPFIAYNYGVRRIRMTTLGVFQFITPTCLFLVGVWIYHEPFGKSNLMSFSLIWVALIIYIMDALYFNSARKAR